MYRAAGEGHQLAQRLTRAIDVAGPRKRIAERGDHLRAAGDLQCGFQLRNRLVEAAHLHQRQPEKQAGGCGTGIELEAVSELVAGLRVPVREVAPQAETDADRHREWIGSHRAAQLRVGLLEALQRHQVVDRIPVMRGWMFRVQLDGAAVLALGLRPGPIVDGGDASQRGKGDSTSCRRSRSPAGRRPWLGESRRAATSTPYSARVA